MTLELKKQDEQAINEIMNPETPGVDINVYANKRKQELRNLPEVQNLNSKIVLEDFNTILTFGEEASTGIAKISNEILNNVSISKKEDKTELLKTLKKLITSIDLNVLTEEEAEEKKMNFLQKIFKKTSDSIDDLLNRYETMGSQFANIEGELKRYSLEIQNSNKKLDQLLLENINFYNELQKYIVAGELALEEMDKYILPDAKIKAETSGDQLEVINYNNYKQAYTMIEQRVLDLQTTETVALQSIPMLKALQYNNFALTRKINSAFVTTLPVFKLGLAEAIEVKRQKSQAEAINALDEETNAMMIRNAKNIVNTTLTLNRMNNSPSIKVETLVSTYNIIKNGIDETLKLEEESRIQREQDRATLEKLNQDLIALNK